jgi:phosphoribosylaminoimidazole-succinocarboxamide synthase
MITTCCAHMADDAGFVFCDLNREFPFECRQLCAAFVADQDSTPDRERLWHGRVGAPAQAQAGAAIAEPGRGHAV